MKSVLSLLVIAGLLLLSCNNGNYSVSGIVQRIETGKDGYTAIIVTKEGDSVFATISRTNMGMRYKNLAIGDYVKIFGDSMMLRNEISLTASRIIEKN